MKKVFKDGRSNKLLYRNIQYEIEIFDFCLRESELKAKNC